MITSWQKPVSRLPLYRNAPNGAGTPQVPMESNSRSSIIRQTQLFSKNGLKPPVSDANTLGPGTHTYFRTRICVPDSHTFWRNRALGDQSGRKTG
jgi:hypothetical protein